MTRSYTRKDAEPHEQWVGLAYVERHGLPGYPPKRGAPVIPDCLRALRVKAGRASGIARKKRCVRGGKLLSSTRTNNDAAQRLAIAGTASPQSSPVPRSAMDVVIVAPRRACVQPQEGA